MRIKPEIDKAIIYRQAGWTIAAITNELGISPSSLYRAFTKLDITRGSITKDTIESARRQLLEQSGLVGDLKHVIASQVKDDLALATQLRTGVAMALDDLINDVTTSASMKARAYASVATTLKLTSDMMRRALQIDDASLSVTEIPVLTILKMTDEDIANVQSRLSDDLEDDDYIEDDELMTIE
jgi:AcrR family transcriptional regulator